MEEHKRLNGEWLQIRSNEDGVESPEEDHGLGTITELNDGIFVVRALGGEPILEGNYNINPNSIPPSIDWTDSTGNDEGKIFPSIYKLTITTFSFCAADEKMERPTSFEPQKGHTIREFIRVI